MFSCLKFIAKKVPLIIASIALVIMMLVVTVNVIGRSFFSSPVFGGVEIISLCGIFLITFALGYTQMEKGHIIIEIMISKLSKRQRIPFAIFSLVLSLITVTLLIWGGLIYFWDAVIKPGSLTLVLHLPSAPFKLVWVIGCATLWGYFLYDLIEVIRKVKKT